MKAGTRRLATFLLASVALLVAQWVMAAGSCVWMSDASAAHGVTSDRQTQCPDQSPGPASCEQHCAFGDAAPDHAKPPPLLDVLQAAPVRVELAAVPLLRIVLRVHDLPPEPPPSIRSTVLRI